jgi:hypothetical protein
MKNKAALLGILLTTLSTQGQTTPNSPAVQPQAASDASRTGASNLTFNDGSGQNFSVDQLASQLQNLRSAVDQTLPVLAAFNQNYSNSLVGGSQSLGGTVSGILSGAINKSGQKTSAPAGQGAISMSNIVTALQGLLSTNHSGSLPVNQNNLRDLVALQNSLQPVTSILQNLNVAGISSNQFAQPYNVTPLSTNGLTPTGR